jgi:shikimate dehydrogenase
MPVIDLAAAPPTCVVMDMVYRPVVTSLLDAAAKLGLRTVDGLQMLIGQARPSFKAFFGRPPPAMDIRALAVTALEPKR